MPSGARWLRSEMPEVIVDANVMVSGIGNRTGSFPARIVDALFSGTVQILLSPLLLAEYRRVLRRPKIRRVHRLEMAELDEYLQSIQDQARPVIPPSSALACPDPNDQHLWDLLASEPDAILVTGDRKLLDSTDFPGRILSPRQFVARHGL